MKKIVTILLRIVVKNQTFYVASFYLNRTCLKRLPFLERKFSLDQGCPTRGPREGFEWPAQYFPKRRKLHRAAFFEQCFAEL